MTMTFFDRFSDNDKFAYRLSIRKLHKKLSLVKEIWSRHEEMTDGYMMDRQTGRQTGKQTNGQHNNYQHNTTRIKMDEGH